MHGHQRNLGRAVIALVGIGEQRDLREKLGQRHLFAPLCFAHILFITLDAVEQLLHILLPRQVFRTMVHTNICPYPTGLHHVARHFISTFGGSHLHAGNNQRLEAIQTHQGCFSERNAKTFGAAKHLPRTDAQL